VPDKLTTIPVSPFSPHPYLCIDTLVPATHHISNNFIGSLIGVIIYLQERKRRKKADPEYIGLSNTKSTQDLGS